MNNIPEPSSARLGGSLATALATPALLLLPQTGQAQSMEPAELSPIRVQGEKPAPFRVDESASSKFSERLLDTARSVEIIPMEVIQSQAASTLTDVLRNSPGITFGAGEGGNPLGDRPFIRGYDAQSSTYIDGMRDIGATSRDIFNTEQVEIIKGPDSVYAGRGGAGGSIDLVSKTARLRDFTDVSLGLGTSRYRRATVDSNWMLGEHSALRLNLMGHRQNVDGRDSVDYKRWGVAPAISFGLGTPTRVSLSYYHMQYDDTPDSGIPYTRPADPDAMRRPFDVDRHNFYGLDSDYRKGRNDMATLRVEHDFSDRLTLINQARYTHSTQKYVVTQPDDSKGNVNHGLVWRRANTRDSRVATWANQTELQGSLATGSIQHRFLLGIELSEEKGRKDSLDVNRGTGDCPPGSAGAASGYNCTSLWNPDPSDPWRDIGTGDPRGENSTTRTLTRSIYAFDTLALSERWLASVGLRLDDYRTRLTPYGQHGVDRHDTLFNYQLGLVYKPADNGSIYATFGTSSTPAGATLGEGSETQGLTPNCRGGTCRGANAADMAPEKNRIYELGTKWDFLDRRLGLTAALFRIETTNARVTLPSGDYAMAGKKHVDGFELGFSGSITPQWQAYGGYTYLRSRIDDDGASGAASDEGNDFPNTPRSSFSLWNTYAFTPTFTAGLGAYYVDRQYGNTANTTSIPAYWRFDAMASYQVNKMIDIQLNVNNLFNKTYYDKAYASHYATVAAGRSVIGTVNLHF
ncbi:TonB-dependent receptor [Castellaniella sp.]|uniref:TonB-dependent receptor n=1 Tax=Castellaniella sp. TaxID=1955812 RepID=UPI0035611E70